MAASLDSVRLLLIQARTNEEIVLQEQQCFAERCRIHMEQIIPVNVVRQLVHDRMLEDVNVLMIGGAGEFSAIDDPKWMASLLKLILSAYDQNLPTFGSCWGHQLIARALGGKVIFDAERAELGCFPVWLTDAGQTDFLFADFPPRFLANMGHHDRVTELPEEAVELAFSGTQPYEAFRIKGKPMYCTQFHSELDARRERERLYVYRKNYPEIGSDESFNKILDSLAVTSEVDHLLNDFLIKFVV